MTRKAKPDGYDWQVSQIKNPQVIASLLHECGFELVKVSLTEESHYYQREGYAGYLLRVSNHAKQSIAFRGSVVVAKHTIVASNSNERELARLYQAIGQYMHLAGELRAQMFISTGGLNERGT